MNEAFREVTGCTARLKPESFDLSVLPDAVGDGPHWITRPDGDTERDAPMMGKAIAYSEIVSGESLWRRLEEEDGCKKNKIDREREWKLVHGR
jgi:hypothetical protein